MGELLQTGKTRKMSSLKNKIVTVFGGTGFVGQHVIAGLVKEGAIVRVPSRLKNSGYALRTGAVVGQVVPMHVDFDQMKTLTAAMTGADYVINLVGILHETSRQKFQTVHAELPGILAKQAKKAGVRQFIQMSALGADIESESVYQKSKAMGEKAVVKAFPEAVILRPSIIFGQGDGFFSRFAGLSRKMPFLPLIGGGKTIFQPVYVGEIVDLILTLLENDSVKERDIDGAIIECGGPATYSFASLLEYMLEIIDVQRPLVSLPWPIASVQAAILECLPGHLLTRDQVRSLKTDNIVTGQHMTLDDFGIVPTPLEIIVPDYLESYKMGGQFTRYRKTG